jgi:hypothetical protein
VKGQFWIDGIVPTSTWNWSNQSIVWYFTEAERAVIGNGSNYKIISSNQSDTNYQIADDINSKQLYFICEYQSLFFFSKLKKREFSIIMISAM